MIKIDIEQLLDRLVELVEKGWRVPLTNKVMVDEERFFSIVEQMRVSVPREIQQAQELQRARDQFIARAQEEAKQILLQANEDAASQLDQYGLRERAEKERGGTALRREGPSCGSAKRGGVRGGASSRGAPR